MSAGLLTAAVFLAGMVSFSAPCCLPRLPRHVADVSSDHGPRRTGHAVTGTPIAIDPFA